MLTKGLVILNQHDADLTVCDDMLFSPQKGFRVYIQVGEIWSESISFNIARVNSEDRNSAGILY